MLMPSIYLRSQQTFRLQNNTARKPLHNKPEKESMNCLAKGMVMENE